MKIKFMEKIQEIQKNIEKLIQLNLIRDIQLKMLKKENEGFVISREIMNEILAEIEGNL